MSRRATQPFLLWSLVCALAGCATARPLTLGPCTRMNMDDPPAPETSSPRPAQPWHLPLPVPRFLRPLSGALRVVVDTGGRPIADSTTICGITNRAYAEDVLASINVATFLPAVRERHAVQVPLTLRFSAP